MNRMKKGNSYKWIFAMLSLLLFVSPLNVLAADKPSSSDPAPNGLDWNVEFTPYKNANGTMLTDSRGDKGSDTADMFDLAGTSNLASVAFYAIKDDNLYFRMTLDDDPRNDASGGLLNSFRAVVQLYNKENKLVGAVGVNGSDVLSDYVYAAGVDPDTNIPYVERIYEYPFSQEFAQDGFRVTANPASGTYHLDFQLPLIDLETATGLNLFDEKFKLVYGTSSRGSLLQVTKDSILNGSMTLDNLPLITFKDTEIKLESAITKVNKGSNPPFADVEQEYEVTYTLTNEGMTTIPDITVNDIPNQAVEILSSSTTTLKVESGSIVWTPGPIQSLESKKLTVLMRFTPTASDAGIPFIISESAYAEIPSEAGSEFFEQEQVLATQDIIGDLNINITTEPYDLDTVVSQIPTPIIRGTTNAADGQKVSVNIAGGTSNRTYSVPVKNGLWSINLADASATALVAGVTYTVEASIGSVSDTQTISFVSSEYSLKFNDKVGSFIDANVLTNDSMYVISGTTTAPVDSEVTLTNGEVYFTAIVEDDPISSVNKWAMEVDISSLGIEDGSYLFEAYIVGKLTDPQTSEQNKVYANLILELDTLAPEATVDDEKLINVLSNMPRIQGTTTAEDGDKVVVVLDLNGDSEFEFLSPDVSYTTQALNGAWAVNTNRTLERGVATFGKVIVTDSVDNTFETIFSILPIEEEVYISVDNSGPEMTFMDNEIEFSGESNAEPGESIMLQLKDLKTNEMFRYYGAIDFDQTWKITFVDPDLNADYLRNGTYSYTVSLINERYEGVKSTGTFKVNAPLPTIALGEYSPLINIQNNIVSIDGSASSDSPEKIAGSLVKITLTSTQTNSVKFDYFSVLDQSGGFSLRSEVLPTTGTFKITILLEDVAFNLVSFTPAEASITVDTQAPTAPKQLVTQTITNQSIGLKWNSSSDNAGLKGYEVYVNEELVDTVSALSYTLSSLDEYADYSIYVRAIDNNENPSENSNVISVKTLDKTPPSVPENLVSSQITDSSFTVGWNESFEEIGSGFSAYEVYLDGKLVNGNVTLKNYKFSGLKPATNYSVTVKSKDKAGNISQPSVALAVTTTKDSTVPTKPGTAVATLVKSDSFRLSWGGSTDNLGITGYEIFLDGKLYYKTQSQALTYTLTGLKNYKLYKTRVRAYDAAGNVSLFNSEISVRTLDTLKPTKPLDLKVSEVKMNTIKLTWTPSTDDSGIKVYEIFIDGLNSKLTTTTNSIEIPSFTKKNAKFQVQAIDNFNNVSEISLVTTYVKRSTLTVKGKTVSVNGKVLNLGTGIAPINKNGVVFLPYRPVLDALGLKSTVSATTKIITASKTGYKVEFSVGKTAYKVNGKTNKTMPVAPFAVKGIVYVPVKFFQNEMNVIYTFSAK